MSKKKRLEGLDRVASTVFLIIFSLVCIVLSACLLFVSKINELVLCYIFCSIVVGWGIVLISRYFGKAGYKKMHDYNFSFGLFIVIVGCSGLVRASEIAQSFDVVVGIICLMIGILLLQSSIQLRSMNSVIWTPELILSLIIVVSSIFILFDVNFLMKRFPFFPYWVLFFASIANLLNFPLLGIKIHFNNKREEKEKMVEVVQQTISSETPEVLEAEIKEIPSSIVEQAESLEEKKAEIPEDYFK